MPRYGWLAYVADDCAESRKVLAFIQAEGVDYIERNVSQDELARMEFEALYGSAPTPVVVWEGHEVKGFDEAALRKLLDRSAS